VEILLKSAEAPAFFSLMRCVGGLWGVDRREGLATFAEERGEACMGGGVLGFRWARRVQADPLKTIFCVFLVFFAWCFIFLCGLFSFFSSFLRVFPFFFYLPSFLLPAYWGRGGFVGVFW